MNRRWTKLLPPVLILGALFLFAPAYLSRDLWFDEALTFLEFAQRNSPLTIYRSYVIPNNQIFYTIALHYWMQLLPPGLDPVSFLRLLSFGFGVATLLLLYSLFRVRLAGGAILLPVLAAMAVSVPFAIYATALRGYMQSAFFVTLALHTALNFAGKPEWKRAVWYALSSLGAVATIPSNLAVLAGVVLYALPLFGNRFWERRAFWVLAAIPPGVFLLFYLPIFPAFLGCLRLGEGWNSPWYALLTVLAAFVYSFAMLLLPGTGSLLAFDREHFKWIRAVRLSIWLIPLPMALLLKVAPFPRVFFPFWPLWALLLAAGIRDLTALNCFWRRRWNRTVWLGALFLVAVGWGFLAHQPKLRLMFSRRFGGAGADDYFYGYYLRPEHTPSRTAGEIVGRFGERPLSVYASFLSDPWPLLFYLNIAGANLRDFRFDGPRGPVKHLERDMLVILRADESPQLIEQRFQRRLKALFSNANHGVYLVGR